ncbi:FecR family protein [Mucilaginibacter sp. UR6-11]|uniref:FecR family protein n=1 Tax=Mucilaginibacter sp. UR6-11 TaxID=1435644 RepID=UPI001E607784|nr:FecR family protein [Mucilaginibacter sp. UR6-11]MCC8423709.1 FecR family protein [Mucilaginibacter sp. UR6-11]
MLHLSTEKLQELSAKWLKGTITAEELGQLEEWYNQKPGDYINWEAGDADEEQLRERLLYNINEVQKEATPVRRLFNKSVIYKAAAMLTIALGATFYYLAVNQAKTGIIADNKRQAQTEAPNNSKAVLTLANGSRVVLDNAGKGLIAKQGNTQINKTQEGKLTYNSDNNDIAAEPQINTISTLAGGKYQITLPDGSRVWLNALTSLRFPTAFKGRERVVELEGEAYFEVAKDKHMPFKVKMANNTSIQVLGTHFNIMAYANEASINATLLEGSINVQKGNVSKLMVPGQEAKITNDINLRQVNAEEAIAWMNGLFSFDKADIRTVMRQLERWYNVGVVYEGKAPDNQITGYISRSSNLPEVIKMLEMSGVKITINGKILKVFNN